MKIRRKRKRQTPGRDRVEKYENVMVTHSDIPNPHDG